MSELHIYIYGEVGLDITPDAIQKQLSAVENPSKIYVHISSPGGGVYDGWTIGNIIDRYDNTEALIEGYCGSIATYIALKCKKVSISETGRFMVHYSSAGLEGNKIDLQKAVNTLDRIDQDLIKTYMKKTGLSRDSVDQMMKDEKEMTSQEAVTLRFVDGMMAPLRAVAKFDFKPNNTNEMSEKVEKIETMVDRFLAKADKLLKNLTGVSNMAVELADGRKLFVESADGELVGKTAYVADEAGNPTEQVAPEGNHALIDGRTISVDATGMVTAVTEAAPVDTEKEQMKSTIAALEAQIAAYKQDNSGLQNQLTETATAVNELIGEVSNLKKMTVGGSFTPSKVYVKPVDKTTTAVVTNDLSAWGKSIFNSKN